MKLINLPLMAAGLNGCAVIALAQPAPTGPVGLSLKPILQADTTMIGQPIRFPQGDVQITAGTTGATWATNRAAS